MVRVTNGGVEMVKRGEVVVMLKMRDDDLQDEVEDRSCVGSWLGRRIGVSRGYDDYEGEGGREEVGER